MIQYRFIVIVFKLLFEVLILYILRFVIDKDVAFILLKICCLLSLIFVFLKYFMLFLKIFD